MASARLMRAAALAVAAALAWLPLSAAAAEQAAPLPPALERRARILFAEIRCPVCEHQSIADSETPLSADLRALVRARLAAGDSEEEIRALIRARYGEFLLFRPSFRARNWLLWLMPFLAFALLLALVWRKLHAAPRR